jgi:thiol-disulfide isomerase/thioredoxin
MKIIIFREKLPRFFGIICLILLFGAHFRAFAAPEFIIKDISGKVHQLSHYQPKWVIVNYWATWCPPCLEEIPDLVALYDSRKNKDLMLIGVVFDYKNKQEVLSYVDDMLMSYPIVMGDASVTKQIVSADVMPTTIIYNPQGELVKVKRGLVTKAYLELIISGANKP